MTISKNRKTGRMPHDLRALLGAALLCGVAGTSLAQTQVIDNSGTTASGSNPAAISTNADGATVTEVIVNNLAGSTIRASTAGSGGVDTLPDALALQITGATGTVTRVNNLGVIEKQIVNSVNQGSFSIASRIIQGSGAGEVVIDNQGFISGGIDFGDQTGSVTFNNRVGGGWRFAGEGHAFGSGADTLSNEAGGFIYLSAAYPYQQACCEDPEPIRRTALDFGAGEDLLVNEGTMLVGEAGFGGGTFGGAVGRPMAAEVTFANLERFENAGLIVMGGAVEGTPTGGYTEESSADIGSALVMPGTTFVGAEGSRIIMDVLMSSDRSQLDCHTRRPNFTLNAADCIDLTGGATSGLTEIIVKDRIRGDLGSYFEEGIVLVDVSGGESGVGHFTLSEASDGYSDRFGGVIDKRTFLFALVYDEAKGQHKLASVPSELLYQMPLLAQAAQSVSRTVTGGWFARQADLRYTLQSREIDEHGVWARVDVTSAEREAPQSVSAYGTTFDFRNDFSQDTHSLTVGLDLLNGGSEDGGRWVAGAMLGYARSKVDFDALSRKADFDGLALGLYASFVGESFFIDVMANSTWLKMDNDNPSLNLFPSGTVLSTNAQIWGLQAEGGRKFRFGKRLSLEPLLALSWVRADFDDMDIPSNDPNRPGNVVAFDAPTSFRGGGGGRLSFDAEAGDLRLQYGLTARAWQEYDETTTVTVETSNADAAVSDSFDGMLTDIVASIAAMSSSGRVSAVLNVGGQFADRYESLGLSAAFRYQW